MTGLVCGLTVLGGCWLTAAASLEDFETWDLGAEELDDEYGMDLYFSSFTPEWERAWRGAGEGTRISLGCVTRERWEMLTEVRLRRELAPWARFRYELLQEQRLSLDKLEHLFGVEISAGGLWMGAYARPHEDKDRHDFGLSVRRSWEAGYDLSLTLTFEDPLNNFWTERSFIEDRERVRFVNRALEWRFGAGRRWDRSRWLRVRGTRLPGFERYVDPTPSSGRPSFTRLLDGSHWQVDAAVDLGPADLELRGTRKQSRLADIVAEVGAASDLRRLAWFLRGRLTHPLHGRWRSHWGAQVRRNREQETADDPYRLRVREILGTVGVSRPLTTWLRLELGYAQMDVDVDQGAATSAARSTHGTRGERRGYLVADFDLRGVRVRLIESFEVDGESYDVIGVHDKGFIQIQAAF